MRTEARGQRESPRSSTAGSVVSWRKGPRAMECRCPLEPGKGKDTDPPLESAEGTSRPQPSDCGLLTHRAVRGDISVC